MLNLKFSDRANGAANAGIIEHNIQATKFTLSHINQRNNLFFFSNIYRLKSNLVFVSLFAQARYKLCASLSIHVANHNASAG